MFNPRITKKEKGLIKGALRRVFSRSELRKAALAKHSIPFFVDPRRPRVTKWAFCGDCGCIEPQYLLQVDHLNPIIKIEETSDDVTASQLVNRMWCEIEYLDPKCIKCHSFKTREENKARREYKRRLNE